MNSLVTVEQQERVKFHSARETKLTCSIGDDGRNDRTCALDLPGAHGFHGRLAQLLCKIIALEGPNTVLTSEDAFQLHIPLSHAIDDTLGDILLLVGKEDNCWKLVRTCMSKGAELFGASNGEILAYRGSFHHQCDLTTDTGPQDTLRKISLGGIDDFR